MACELLSPAGDFKTALAAFEAGADAVYCGLAEFSARAFADNFSPEDLKNLLRYARSPRGAGESGVPRKVYVTFNTVIDEDSLEAAIGRLAWLGEVRPDALIVQDLGVARICRRHFPELELHASTQLVAHNLEGVLALKELGFRRVVLARELSLDEIVSIANRCGARRVAPDGRSELELEVFIHGALCYSLSGLCLFGAMEKGRSGNRGRCPYCCRLPYDTDGGGRTLAFSMKDLRLGEDVRKLVDAGVTSLKIEGRMKSALYVASVTRYYRQILGEREEGRGKREEVRGRVTVADLETVFSRRTTKLYFDGRNQTIKRSGQPSDSPVDPESLGHLGAEIGRVKRVTRDRDGLSWLRFHTARSLEKHDGLQFEAMTDGRHVGMGVVEMRQAISRRPVFEVNAGTDVEVLVTDEVAAELKPGMRIYCSMSNAVKRMFPVPSFRPSDCEGGVPIDVEVTVAEEGLSCRCEFSGGEIQSCRVRADLRTAKDPGRTEADVRKAFSRLGGTDYRLGRLTVNDPGRLFAPMGLLNDLRRELVEKLDDARERRRRERREAAIADDPSGCGRPPEAPRAGANGPVRRVKLRPGQKVPPGEWDEVIVAIGPSVAIADLPPSAAPLRLALPVYEAEPEFNRLRSAVKRFMRAGYARWEVCDLATLRMLKGLGVTDVTADWTLYAFNSQALAALAEYGVSRFVASPENGRENLRYLAESGYDVEFPVQQSTPLFLSLTKPAADCGDGEQLPRLRDLTVFWRDGLWVTTRKSPRTFEVPAGVPTRLDLSWDPA